MAYTSVFLGSLLQVTVSDFKVQFIVHSYFKVLLILSFLQWLESVLVECTPGV